MPWIRIGRVLANVCPGLAAPTARGLKHPPPAIIAKPFETIICQIDPFVDRPMTSVEILDVRSVHNYFLPCQQLTPKCRTPLCESTTTPCPTTCAGTSHNCCPREERTFAQRASKQATERNCAPTLYSAPRVCAAATSATKMRFHRKSWKKRSRNSRRWPI